jgi:hypothetical protein
MGVTVTGCLSHCEGITRIEPHVSQSGRTVTVCPDSYASFHAHDIRPQNGKTKPHRVTGPPYVQVIVATPAAIDRVRRFTVRQVLTLARGTAIPLVDTAGRVHVDL